MLELAAFVASIARLDPTQLVAAMRAEVLRIGGSWMPELDGDPERRQVLCTLSLHHVFASGQTTTEACERWRATAGQVVDTLTTIDQETYP